MKFVVLGVLMVVLACGHASGRSTEAGLTLDDVDRRIAAATGSLVKRLEVQEAVIERLESENAAMEQYMAHFLAPDTKSIQVAFSMASTATFGPVTIDSNIPFDHELLNVEGGYDNGSYSFQPPVSGVYAFSASMLHADTTGTTCNIVHTSEAGTTTIVSTMRGEGEDGVGDANSVVIQLELGDSVSVQLEMGSGMVMGDSDHMYTTFSGFLLFQ